MFLQKFWPSLINTNNNLVAQSINFISDKFKLFLQLFADETDLINWENLLMDVYIGQITT